MIRNILIIDNTFVVMSLNYKIKKDKLLILDLDGTLIYTELLNIHNENTTLDTFIIKDDNENRYLVKERPFLRKFIHEANKLYNLGVWTASKKCYADAIISNIFDGITLEIQYSENHCKKQIDQKNNIAHIIKPISKILDVDKTYNPKNVLVVDDNVTTFSENPNNAIHIDSWKGEDDDNTLSVLIHAIKMAAKLDDVRKIGEVWKDEQEKIDKQIE